MMSKNRAILSQPTPPKDKEPNTNILDKFYLKEMAKDLCGNRDLLDEKVIAVLAQLAEHMVENVIDQSCMYAKHRCSDTLEKEDLEFASRKIFPDLAHENKSFDIQAQIEQANLLNQMNAALLNESGTLAIGVGGLLSTANYKQKLLRVRKEQEQQISNTNLKQSIQ